MSSFGLIEKNMELSHIYLAELKSHSSGQKYFGPGPNFFGTVES